MVTATADNMTIKYFDTFEYVKKSKEIKDPEALAEYQVKQIESAIESAVRYVKNETNNDIKDLATKSDIIQLRYDTLVFVVRSGIGVVVTLSGMLGGMMAHGFHWI